MARLQAEIETTCALFLSVLMTTSVFLSGFRFPFSNFTVLNTISSAKRIFDFDFYFIALVVRSFMHKSSM